MNIRENVSLSTLNTLAVPSVAERFCEFHSLEELGDALEWARTNSKKSFILSGGSNVLLPEKIQGLVLVPKIRGIEVQSESDRHVELNIGAGENWHNLVMWSVEQAYCGLENLALIPGNAGAAPIQNIGAYGVELCDTFISLSAFDLNANTVVELDKEDCEFGYRDSIFKGREKSRYIILSIRLKLTKNTSANVSYPALFKVLEEKYGKERKGVFSALEAALAVVEIRQSKLPAPEQFPNAGSFFKNPVVSSSKLNELREQYPNIVSFKIDDDNHKLAAAWMIDNAGWKGKAEQGIAVHAKQALVIINTQHQNVSAILKFAEKIQANVLKLFGVELEIEPQQLAPL